MFPLFLPIFLSIFPFHPSHLCCNRSFLHNFLYFCPPFLSLCLSPLPFPSFSPSVIHSFLSSFFFSSFSFLLSFLYFFPLFHPFISSFLSLSLHIYHSSGMVIFTLFDARLTHYSELLEERHRFAAKQMTVPRAHRICCSLSLACGGVIGVGTTRTQ